MKVNSGWFKINSKTERKTYNLRLLPIYSKCPLFGYEVDHLSNIATNKSTRKQHSTHKRDQLRTGDSIKLRECGYQIVLHMRMSGYLKNKSVKIARSNAKRKWGYDHVTPI